MPLFWGAILQGILKGGAGTKTAAVTAAKGVRAVASKAGEITSIGENAAKLGEKVGGKAGVAIEGLGRTMEDLQSLSGGGAAGVPSEANPSASVPFGVTPVLSPSDQSQEVGDLSPEILSRLQLENRPRAASPFLGANQQGGQREGDLSLEELKRRRLARRLGGF